MAPANRNRLSRLNRSAISTGRPQGMVNGAGAISKGRQRRRATRAPPGAIATGRPHGIATGVGAGADSSPVTPSSSHSVPPGAVGSSTAALTAPAYIRRIEEPLLRPHLHPKKLNGALWSERLDCNSKDTIEMGMTVMCRLVDAEGIPLGDPMYIPQQAGPLQLSELANRFLNNEEKLQYTFYVSGEELRVPVGNFVGNRSVSVEEILTILYRPQAVFRTRPVSRISASIAGHEDSVLCVSFSPDGTQLASGSGDTTVRLWDLYTQTPMFTCRGHTDSVLSVAWSPDGKHLVSGDRAGNICCWIPETGKLDGSPLRGHKKWITSISWEPVHLSYPCRRFVTSSKDEDARIWDITLKKCVTCLSGHSRGVTCVKWGGDGIIYTGSQDRTIKMWQVTPEGLPCLKAQLKGHGHWVNSLALSTEYVLRTGAFDHTGKHYSSPEEVRKAALKRYNQAKGKFGERLVSGSDDFTLILWDQSVSDQPKEHLILWDQSVSDQPKEHLLGHQQLVSHVYFSPNGQWIASASFDKSVRIWDGITGAYITTLRGHIGPVYQISWSPDSRMLLSGSRDSTIKIWDIGQRRLKQDLPGHADEVYALDWSPDGERVVSGGRDKCLKLWVG